MIAQYSINLASMDQFWEPSLIPQVGSKPPELVGL